MTVFFILIVLVLAWMGEFSGVRHWFSTNVLHARRDDTVLNTIPNDTTEIPSPDELAHAYPNAPPRIYGVQDIYVQQGGSIMFRRGVSAFDYFDNPINFAVDSSNVDVSTLGSYAITYSAIDDWGQITEKTAYVHVVEVEPDIVRALADVILDGILRENMTQVEQARAIFQWVGGNISYAATAGNRTLYEGAYQAIRYRNGDCYVFFAISELMLTRAGIPNMKIARVGGNTSHFWNLINPDDLGWHHFDATPLRAQFNDRVDRFMFTSSQAQVFTEIIWNEIRERNYYVYDPDLYPEIVQ